MMNEAFVLRMVLRDCFACRCGAISFRSLQLIGIFASLVEID